MRLNKRVFYFSTWISIITLLVSCILYFGIEENTVIDFIVNICMNIFAGSMVLIVTSLFDYFIQKRDLLEKIYQEGNSFFRIFNKIKYFEDDKYDFEKFLLLNKNLKKQKISEQKNIYNQYIKNFEKVKKEEILKVIDVYLEISEYDYIGFWNLYKELDFIWDWKKKTRKFLYNELFNYIHKIVNEIQKEVYHFKIYKESENGNYFVNSNKIKELQKKIFYVETIKNNEEFKCKEKYRDYPIYQLRSDSVTGTSKIIINDIAFNINKTKNKVYDITYARELKKEKREIKTQILGMKKQ